MMEATDRLFLGIRIPEEIRQALQIHLRDSSGDQPLPGRAVSPDNWHLTLRFLGDTARSHAERVCGEIRNAPLGPPFQVHFGTCGAFPRPARASVLWVGIRDGAAELTELAAAIEAAVRRAGIAPETKPFTPHLTLARIRPPRNVQQWLDQIPPAEISFRVDEVVLFRSHLRHGPPRYEVVSRFPLSPELLAEGA